MVIRIPLLLSAVCIDVDSLVLTDRVDHIYDTYYHTAAGSQDYMQSDTIYSSMLIAFPPDGGFAVDVFQTVIVV